MGFSLAEVEPGTFYLTDFLVRSFEALVIRGLGLDRHPELLPVYFGNYRRVVYLAQADDPILTERAELAARRLGLAFERRLTGVGELGPAIRAFAGGTSAGRRPIDRPLASTSRMGGIHASHRTQRPRQVPQNPLLGARDNAVHPASRLATAGTA